MSRSDYEIMADLARLKGMIRKETTIEDLIERAKTREGIVLQKHKTQVGALVHRELWQQFKVQAAVEARPVGSLLEDAISAYLDKNSTMKSPAIRKEQPPATAPPAKKNQNIQEVEQLILDRDAWDAWDIANYLNENGHKTARGKVFNQNVINKMRGRLRKKQEG